jgi:hypothetical protein
MQNCTYAVQCLKYSTKAQDACTIIRSRAKLSLFVYLDAIIMNNTYIHQVDDDAYAQQSHSEYEHQNKKTELKYHV